MGLLCISCFLVGHIEHLKILREAPEGLCDLPRCSKPSPFSLVSPQVAVGEE